jgi:hypothetical protein
LDSQNRGHIQQGNEKDLYLQLRLFFRRLDLLKLVVFPTVHCLFVL